MSFRCAVFDLDDTLYLERDYVRSGFRAVGQWVHENIGPDQFFDLAWRRFEQGSRRTIFNEVLADLEIEVGGELIGQLVQVYRTHRPTIALPEDSKLCLEKLGGALPLALITDGPLECQQAKIESLGVAQWIPQIICTSALGPDRGKPHPQAFEMVERETGVRGAEILYLADNPSKDFHAPNQLGWHSIRVRREQGIYYDLESEEAPPRELADLAEIPAIALP